jgi:hypothetical protein
MNEGGCYEVAHRYAAWRARERRPRVYGEADDVRAGRRDRLTVSLESC